VSARTPHDPATTQPWWQRLRVGPPLLAFAAGWIALLAWSGLVTDARRYLAPAFVIGLLVALTGIGLRFVRAPAALTGAAQVLVALLGLNAVAASGPSWLGVIPTRTSVEQTAYLVANGAATLNVYSSPVGVNPRSTQAMLVLCALAVLVSVDLLTTWLRRPPLVALPLLVTLSVPVSILRDSLELPVFIGVTLLYLRLLASDQLDRLRRWRPDGSGALPRGVGGVLWGVSGAAVLLALVTAPLVPVTDLLQRNTGSGPGDGNGAGGGYSLTVVNPFIRLRRDLVEQTHTPLVYARTDATSTGYLRTTVLDQFTSDQWKPSPRNLPSSNVADGPFPDPPGLDDSVDGKTDRWQLQLAPNFATTWLPLPYPVRRIEVAGSWRYDSRTLDVAYTGAGAPSELRYQVSAFEPDLTATLLQESVSPPANIKTPYTRVPSELPAVIKQRAEEVTRGATTQYAKAVALQDWFRQGGGFQYSTEQRSGSGMQLLADFVTNDRIGYCEQFASAMAAMGRTLGIPSRVVVGFLDGTPQPDGRILYSSDDRHAWPEMYFTGVGWVRFEPTPGQRAASTPSYTQQQEDPTAPSAAPTQQPSQAPVTPRDQLESDTSTSSSGGPQIPWVPVLGGLGVLVLALGPSVLRIVMRRRRLAGHDLVELSEGAWAELRATAVDLGLDWPERRSPREQARTVLAQVGTGPDETAGLEGLLAQVERGRYARGSDVPADPETRARTLDTVSTWRRVLQGSVQRSRGWRAKVLPASLLRR
jgi:transglutaminase-like putative cysteine protease